MTDQDKELRMRISMLMDSDLDGRDNPRLINSIASEDELKSTWARYILIGDVMRCSGKGQLAGKDFANRISAMVSEEPTVLAPRALIPVINSRSRIVSLSLAASLTVMAVIVGKSFNDNPEVFQTASYQSTIADSVAAKPSEQAESLADSQFNDYLVMHNETAYTAGSAAMLPYVRVAGSRPSH